MFKKKGNIPRTLLILSFPLSILITNFMPILICPYASTVANQTSIPSTSSVVDAIAVWQHGETGTRDIWYSIWDDTDTKWWSMSPSKAAPVTELIGDDLDPSIAFNRQKNAICVWSHDTLNATSGHDIWYSMWSGSGWTPPSEIAQLPGDDMDPAIAFDTNGWAIAIWIHNGTCIYYSLWDGTNWIGPAQAIVPDWPQFPPSWSNLPEICFTSSKTKGGSYTDHQAVAIWTHTATYPEVPPETRSRIYYAVWDGKVWSPSPAEEISGQARNAADNGNPAMSRNGISSDNFNNALAVWGTEDKKKPIYYAIWDGHRWSDATALDTQRVYGIMPAVAFDIESDAILIFTHNTTNIWHSKFTGGTWQAASQIANTSGNDFRPSTAFSGIGRAISVWWSDAGTFAPSEIFYSFQYSTTGWTQAASIVPEGLPGSDTNPAIASASGSPTMPPIELPSANIHDIAVLNTTPSKTVAGQNYTLYIYVTVENQGNISDMFDVTAYYNSSEIGTIKEASLNPTENKTLTFTWNTTSVNKGKYVISAQVSVVIGETDTTDNALTDGTVQITIPGDINGDRTVDIYDLSGVSKAYGTTPGTPNWNENADITGDSHIDIRDVAICSKNYGMTDL